MSVTPIAHATDTLEAIKARPHWHVVLEPCEFRERRAQSLDECWRLLESCRVALRERDYPHIYDDNRQNGDSWIASWGRSKWQEGYGRFFQSGQFVHRLSLFEDEVVEQGLAKSRHIDYLEVLYTVTEVFEFAARLAQRDTFGNSVSITIEVQEIANRMLATTAHPQFLRLRASWAGYPVRLERLLGRIDCGSDRWLGGACQESGREFLYPGLRVQTLP